MELREKIEYSINETCAENGSNTPDFVLAEYLTDCLVAFDKAVGRRDDWYGMKPYPGWDHKSNLIAPSIDQAQGRRANEA